eukprot:SAG31_NODE_3604_length_4078_cov_1.491832_2_plen_373_part_00
MERARYRSRPPAGGTRGGLRRHTHAWRDRKYGRSYLRLRVAAHVAAARRRARRAHLRRPDGRGARQLEVAPRSPPGGVMVRKYATSRTAEHVPWWTSRAILYSVLTTVMHNGPCVAAAARATATDALSAPPECTTASSVVDAAYHLCSTSPIELTLQSIGLRPLAAQAASRLLAENGFHSALDLRLLLSAEGPEAQELMESLKDSGELYIGDRAKIRLVLGAMTATGDMVCERREPEIRRAHAEPGRASSWHSMGSITKQNPIAPTRRQLQADDSPAEPMSMDTLAIVMTVLLGAAGYLVQSKHFGHTFILGTCLHGCACNSLPCSASRKKRTRAEPRAGRCREQTLSRARAACRADRQNKQMVRRLLRANR